MYEGELKYYCTWINNELHVNLSESPHNKAMTLIAAKEAGAKSITLKTELYKYIVEDNPIVRAISTIVFNRKQAEVYVAEQLRYFSNVMGLKLVPHNPNDPFQTPQKLSAGEPGIPFITLEVHDLAAHGWTEAEKRKLRADAVKAVVKMFEEINQTP